ncbi:MAG TPA: HEAT repeat domain-containing protein, partial [Pyrinomonadaceae bacterium]|nr:HEAT repeat domain-containing protein [Pyrinomonadaceae bacterium]
TLLPLLPWLSNPSWFTNEPSHRVSLIRKLTSVEIPESVPELIWIVENETRDNCSYAAQTLARYKDPRAVPALRRALMNQTQVGRYNLKDFSFKSILTLPHISFDSLSMWVDAKSEKLYVVYNGELLRLPFQSSAN